MFLRSGHLKAYVPPKGLSLVTTFFLHNDQYYGLVSLDVKSHIRAGQRLGE